MSSNVDSLRAELETLVAHGTHRIQAERSRRARPFAFGGGLAMISRLCPLAAAVLFAAWLFRVPAPAWPVAAGIVLACGGLVFLLMLRTKLLPVSRGDALALWDRAAGLEDRLLAADEFLRSPPPGEGGFVAAAIEDAAQHVARAREARIEPQDGPRLAGSSILAAVFGLAILLAIDLLPRRVQDAGDTVVVTAAGAPGPTVAGAEDEPDPSDPNLAPRPEPRSSERSPRKPATAGAAAETDPGAMSDRVKRSLGRTGEGRSADARASSKASQARGAPSSQSQTSQGRAKEPEESKERKAKPTDPPENQKKKQDEQNSGSTAGQGSSKGSSKNPAATDWSSKDQVTTPEDAEIEDDEEIEDEEEEQESRGGVQPSLRDRRPPVSRDLRIGFGNRPNPDANGRGGPSAPKKSRGVASLVLGVPIPDRVKGQPNPGKTKITQERIEPRPEESTTLDAESRGTRQGPLGRLGRPDMTPWMRTLVRDYFLARRAQETEEDTE